MQTPIRGKISYRDKNSNRTIQLEPSYKNFLVLAEPNDAEVLQPLVSQNVFSITPSTNNDGVFILQVKSEEESLVEIENTLQQLRDNERIKEVAPALLDSSGQMRYILPGRIVVQFRNLSDAAVAQFLAGLRSSIFRKFRSRGLYEVGLPSGSDLADFIDSLNANARVVFAEPSYYGVNDIELRFKIVAATRAPHLPTEDETVRDQPLSWNLERLSLHDAWRLTTGDSRIVVAVVDGIPESDHEALAGKFITPISDDLIFSQDRSVSSHATKICSIIAGESSRLKGVAPKVALLPLAVNLRSQTYAERADAINFATELATRKSIHGQSFSRLILSCSWKTSGDIAVVRAALEAAVAADVLVIFSAGNENVDSPHFPSDYSAGPGSLADGIISVAATDQDDRRAEYSNFSSKVDVSAPGGNGLPLDARDILCADQGNSYEYGAGTSLAVPHVAGLAALLLSLNPNLTPRELKRLIKESADNIGAQNPGYIGRIGVGRVNAKKALSLIEAIPSRIPDESPRGVGKPANGRVPASSRGPQVHIESRPRGPRVRFERAESQQ